MKHNKAVVIMLLIMAISYAGQSRTAVQLSLYPAKAIEKEQKYNLLPTEDELIDIDAALLYEKAIESLPEDFNTDQINQLRKTPLDELKQEKVQAILESFKTTLQLLKEASECKQCDWNYYALNQNLNTFRNLAFVLTLQIRFQIAQDQYDNAIDSVQTGLALANNLGKDYSLITGLVAVAVTELICQQIDQFVQRPDAPNLYQAIRDLPSPFIDLSKSLEVEDEDVRQRINLQTNRVERHIAALQCIEALRLYACAHEGKFPDKPSDVTEFDIPNDPITKEPFKFIRTGSEAVLELEGTEDSQGRDSVRYELILRE